MSFQSLGSELTAKILFLANLQRNLMHNQNSTNEKAAEGATLTSTLVGQQQNHPLLMPSLNVSSQKISDMLTALTPLSTQNNLTAPTNITSTEQTTLSFLALTNNNYTTQSRMTTSSSNTRANGSNFGWGNRERKMEENWRMQNRNV